MTTEEERLADWFEQNTPEPPALVTADQVASMVGRSRPGRWALPATAAAIIVLLVAALAVALSDTAEHHSQPIAPPPSQTRSLQSVPASPQPSFVAPNAPWQARQLGSVALAVDSTAALDGRLYGIGTPANFGSGTPAFRLDPATGRAVATSKQSVLTIRPVFAGDTVWFLAASTVATSVAGDIEVVGLDPQTLDVKVAVPISHSAHADRYQPSLSTDGRHVYVGMGEIVAMVDAIDVFGQTGPPVPGRTLKVDGLISGLAISPDGAKLYVAIGAGAGAGNVEIRDPMSGARIQHYAEVGPVIGLVASDTGVWGTSSGGHLATITFFPSSGQRGETTNGPVEAGVSGGGPTVYPSISGGVTWLGGYRDLACVDPDSQHMRAYASNPAPEDGVVYYSGLTALGHTLYGIATATGGGTNGGTYLVAMMPPSSCWSS